MGDTSELLILLGTHDDYIYGVLFDEVSRTLRLSSTTKVSPHPSWLARHPTVPNIVYANGHVEGKVFALTVDDFGAVTGLDEADSGGRGPTSLALLPDHSALVIAHYLSGNVTMMPLSPEGRFLTNKTEPSHHFNPKYSPLSHPRQESAHAHQVVIHGAEVLVPDLGSNKVWRLRLGGQEDISRWVVNGEIGGLEDGDGPRHVVVHPNGKTLYVLNEVSSCITVHTLSASGPSELLSRISLLPPRDAPLAPHMTAGEIILLRPARSNCPSLLLATNRDSKQDKGDAIALFAVHGDGTLERGPQPWFYGVGKHIRALESDPTGRWVIAAGRDQGGVVMMERKGTEGLELEIIARLQIPNVVVPVWMTGQES